MKKTLILASFAALAFVAGCASSDTKSDSGSMGVVGDCKKDACCSQKSEGGSMGVMSDDKKSCPADKSHCTTGGTCPMGKGDKQN